MAHLLQTAADGAQSIAAYKVESQIKDIDDDNAFGNLIQEGVQESIKLPEFRLVLFEFSHSPGKLLKPGIPIPLRKHLFSSTGIEL